MRTIEPYPNGILEFHRSEGWAWKKGDEQKQGATRSRVIVRTDLTHLHRGMKYYRRVQLLLFTDIKINGRG